MQCQLLLDNPWWCISITHMTGRPTQDDDYPQIDGNPWDEGHHELLVTSSMCFYMCLVLNKSICISNSISSVFCHKKGGHYDVHRGPTSSSLRLLCPSSSSQAVWPTARQSPHNHPIMLLLVSAGARKACAKQKPNLDFCDSHTDRIRILGGWLPKLLNLRRLYPSTNMWQGIEPQILI